MKSLKIGNYIFEILSAYQPLVDLVGSNVYPLMEQHGIKFPFVVYFRERIGISPNKDMIPEDDVFVLFACVSDKYSESTEIASVLVEAFDNKIFPDYEMKRVLLQDVAEDYIEGAYVQQLTFKFIIKR